MRYGAPEGGLQRVGAYRPPSTAGFPSLTETVGEFCRDIVRLKDELRESRLEVGRLQRELAAGKGPSPRTPGSGLNAMRREISFYCHPDRGGDNELMQRVNALFDYLEYSPALRAELE